MTPLKNNRPVLRTDVLQIGTTQHLAASWLLSHLVTVTMPLKNKRPVMRTDTQILGRPAPPSWDGRRAVCSGYWENDDATPPPPESFTPTPLPAPLPDRRNNPASPAAKARGPPGRVTWRLLAFFRVIRFR